MTVAKKKIKNAFIDWVTPVLTDRGFQGVFPNYRREKGEHIDIISFQFSLFDDAFCVGIAKCPSSGITFSNGKTLSYDVVTANHCPKSFMLGTQEGDLSHWFKFNPSQHQLRTGTQNSSLTMYDDSLLKFKRIAEDIVKLLDQEAETWWQDSEEWWKDRVPDYNTLFFDIQRLVAKGLYE